MDRMDVERRDSSTAHPVVEYAGLEVGRGLSQRRPAVAAVRALSKVVREPRWAAEDESQNSLN